MSRPFSYNDENFTVIGNILFVHAHIFPKSYAPGDKIFAIPPAICDRMITFNTLASMGSDDHAAKAGSLYIFVDKDGNVVTVGKIPILSTSLQVLSAWFILKDF